MSAASSRGHPGSQSVHLVSATHLQGARCNKHVRTSRQHRGLKAGFSGVTWVRRTQLETQYSHAHSHLKMCNQDLDPRFQADVQ